MAADLFKWKSSTRICKNFITAWGFIPCIAHGRNSRWWIWLSISILVEYNWFRIYIIKDLCIYLVLMLPVRGYSLKRMYYRALNGNLVVLYSKFIFVHTKVNFVQQKWLTKFITYCKFSIFRRRRFPITSSNGGRLRPF